MVVLAYNYHFDPDDACLIKLDGTREQTDEIIDHLSDSDANYDSVNAEDGDYIELSYNDENMYVRKCGSPEEIIEDLTEIAREQWDDEVVYFEDLGGTRLDTEDYDSPEELAEAAYDIYYTDSYVDGDSNYRNEIIRFDASEYVGAEQWIEENIAADEDDWDDEE